MVSELLDWYTNQICSGQSKNTPANFCSYQIKLSRHRTDILPTWLLTNRKAEQFLFYLVLILIDKNQFIQKWLFIFSEYESTNNHRWIKIDEMLALDSKSISAFLIDLRQLSIFSKSIFRLFRSFQNRSLGFSISWNRSGLSIFRESIFSPESIFGHESISDRSLI